ncbi:hypothetical protein D922_02421 [Enterococcus faecalis 06-MB-DW-09]|nr:hypothetical protein D922_02421 [Enterococcus faecalis 06-MB-DW-09]
MILTYDIDDLYIDDLVAKPRKTSSNSISAAESPKNDIKPKSVVVGDSMLCNCSDESLDENPRTGEDVGSITADVIKTADIKQLAESISNQTTEEMRRSL